jgi:GntR family transcriptional repressor for pyruvate dehydrogenase complex
VLKFFKPLVTHNTSLYNRIVEEIRSALEQGKLQPGDRLPPEREMAVQLGVSRTSLREAMKVLAGRGIVSIRHGQGIYMADGSTHQLVNEMARLLMRNSGTLSDLFEIRRLLESSAAGWAAERATAEQLAALVQVVAEARAGAESDTFSTKDYERHDHRFHMMLAELTGNAVLVHVMDNMIDLLREGRKSSLSVPGRPQRSIADHDQILAAIGRRDPEAAKKAMIHHLESVERSIEAGVIAQDTDNGGQASGTSTQHREDRR